MILGAVMDGIQVATQAAEAAGSAIRVGAAELVRQERIFWGLDPNAATPAVQAQQDAELRETAWGQKLGPNVPIEVLRSIDRLPTEEDKMLLVHLLNGTIQLGREAGGLDDGAIALNEDPESVLEAALKQAGRFRDELELQQFAAGEGGSSSPALTSLLGRAADLLEQFAAVYANGGHPLNVYA